MKLIYTGESIREAEKPYVQAPDYNGYLMQRAADALAEEAYDTLVSHGAPPHSGRVLLLVGPGNNGADTVYAGVRLHRLGYSIDAVLFDPTGRNLELIAREAGEGTRVLHTEQSLRNISDYSLIIDGILGTGARGPVRGEAGEYLGYLRSLQQLGTLPPVIACDIPSGVDSNDGTLNEPSLAAVRTVTFIGHKLPTGTGTAEHCGSIRLHTLGVPHALDNTEPALRVLETKDYRRELETPTVESHKYTRGVLGMLTGTPEYPGAALMSVHAAINTGVGMVRFGVNDEKLHALMLAHNPETVCFSGPARQQQVHAWAGGSGTTSSEPTNRYLIEAPEPAVLDAGAVDTVAEYLLTGKRLTAHKILTPHAGELQRLLAALANGLTGRWAELMQNTPAPSRDDITRQPLRWVKTAAALTGATVMLKGGYSLIASPADTVYSVRGATAWLATAGSGDTLTGILGALLAQKVAAAAQCGTPLEDDVYARVAALAVYLHGRAALTSLGGRRGPVPPTRVVQSLPQAIAELLEY